MASIKKNLETELLLERQKLSIETIILDEVRSILSANDVDRNVIKKSITQISSTKENNFDFDLLDSDKIFHINQIKTICIDYRLRFLNSSFFKTGIPEEAISKINALEKVHHCKLEGFKIMAPTKAFKLLSYDDPLLFAPIGNDYFYLIHKWGNDITPNRKWIMKPFKNLLNFVLFCFFISVILTFLTPENNLSKSVPMADVIILLFMFKSIIAVFLYAFFMMGKNFNTCIWNRVYFNN